MRWCAYRITKQSKGRTVMSLNWRFTDVTQRWMEMRENGREDWLGGHYLLQFPWDCLQRLLAVDWGPGDAASSGVWTPRSCTHHCPTPARTAGQGRRHRLPGRSRWEAPTSAHHHTCRRRQPTSVSRKGCQQVPGGTVCPPPHCLPTLYMTTWKTRCAFFFFFEGQESINKFVMTNAYTHERKTNLIRTQGKEMICSLSWKTNTKKTVKEYI